MYICTRKITFLKIKGNAAIPLHPKGWSSLAVNYMEKYDNIPISFETTKNIMEVINEFDFDKVYNVMNYLNWQWHRRTPHIPNIDELKDEALRHLTSAYNGFWCSEDKKEKHFIYISSSGGFEASYWYDFESKEDNFTLKFILESFDDC